MHRLRVKESVQPAHDRAGILGYPEGKRRQNANAPRHQPEAVRADIGVRFGQPLA